MKAYSFSDQTIDYGTHTVIILADNETEAWEILEKAMTPPEDGTDYEPFNQGDWFLSVKPLVKGILTTVSYLD